MSATIPATVVHPALALGLELLRQARVAEAIPELERAAAAGTAEASAVLGDVLLTAGPPLRAPWRAVAHLELAWPAARSAPRSPWRRRITPRPASPPTMRARRIG